MGARVVSLQKFSLEVFKFNADPSFAFVSSDYIQCNCPKLPANKEMFIKQLKKTYGGWWRSQFIILSLAQQDKKSDCSDSFMYTSYSMLRT